MVASLSRDVYEWDACREVNIFEGLDEALHAIGFRVEYSKRLRMSGSLKWSVRWFSEIAQ